MLRSSLKTLGGESLCAAAGLDASVRAEVVDSASFLRLADLIGSVIPDSAQR
jgi:16S rRNA (adenine1518-N6/adenine1519-N6)-dimethyltransferase